MGGMEVQVNIKGVLEAAHEAIAAFFLLWEVFGLEARVWWVFCHRAFLQGVCVGDLLRSEMQNGNAKSDGADAGLWARARSDIARVVEIMTEMSIGEEPGGVCSTRVEVLRKYLPLT